MKRTIYAVFAVTMLSSVPAFAEGMLGDPDAAVTRHVQGWDDPASPYWAYFHNSAASQRSIAANPATGGAAVAVQSSTVAPSSAAATSAGTPQQ